MQRNIKCYVQYSSQTMFQIFAKVCSSFSCKTSTSQGIKLDVEWKFVQVKSNHQRKGISGNGAVNRNAVRFVVLPIIFVIKWKTITITTLSEQF